LLCFFFFAFAVLLVAVAVEARLGVDVSHLWKQESWDCINGKGYEFAIVRCFRSSDSVDPNCAESVKRAWAAGMKHVDLYMYPAPNRSDVAEQVRRLDKHIRDNNITYGQIWIDIEGADKYWSVDKKENRKTFNVLCTTAVDVFGTRFAGVYVSKQSWEDILGSDYKEWGNLKLWYPDWDHKPGKGNWKPYGGFSGPFMHQYWGDQKELCKMNVDLNYLD